MTSGGVDPHPFRTALLTKFKSGGLGQIFDEFDNPDAPNKKKIGYRLAVSPDFPRRNLQEYLRIHAYDLKREPVTLSAIAIVVTYDQLKPEYRPAPEAPIAEPATPQPRSLLSRLLRPEK